MLVDRIFEICYIELTNINKHMNKYKKWYNNIVKRGQTPRPDLYTENHHIVPDAFYKNRSRSGRTGWLDGNPEDPANKTELTAKEHLVCHWLLTRIYKEGRERHVVLNAVRMLQAKTQKHQRYTSRLTGRLYQRIKEEYSQLQSQRFSGKGNGFYGKKHTPEARAAISQKNTGKKLTEAQIAKQVAAQTGRTRKPFSNEWRNNMAKNHKSKQPDFDGSLKEETKKKIGDKIRGRKQTDEEKARRSAANMGRVKPKKLCPHCNQLIAVNGYARWHGDNCKSLRK